MRPDLCIITDRITTRYFAVMQSTYPGLEKEQESPNSGAGPAYLRWPSRTPISSPLAACQAKAGKRSEGCRCCTGLHSSAGVDWS